MNTKSIKIISAILAILALAIVVLANFMPMLNIKLDGVQSDYTFNTPGGHDILGWQCTFYWWGPSIFIGGVTACHPNVWLIIGVVLPILTVLITTPMLIRALYKKKAVVEFINAAVMALSAVLFLNATGLAQTTVGNHLQQYMVMAIEQGTYTLGWFTYVLAAVLAVVAAFKIFSGIYSLKNEEEAARLQALADEEEEEDEED